MSMHVPPIGGDPLDDDERALDEEREELPEHERDDPRHAGAGVMSGGGTAVDRGTGTQQGHAEQQEAFRGAEDEPTEDGGFPAIVDLDEPAGVDSGEIGRPEIHERDRD